MKKLTALTLAAILAAGTVAVKAETAVKLIVDNKIVNADVVTENDRTLVPLRALMETADAEVIWHGETKQIDVKRGDKALTLQIGSNIMKSATGDRTLDAAPAIYGEGTTYLPIRAVCEELGMSVEWDGGTKTVLVTTPDGYTCVDFHNGLTVEDFAAMNDMTNDELAREMGLEYSEIQGMLYAEATNMQTLGFFTEQGGITVEEFSEYYEVDNVDANTTIGEFVGELTLENFINYAGLGQFFQTSDEALAYYRQYYELGEEYSLDTKYKFVRTIVDTKELERILAQQKKEEEMERLASEASEKLDELTQNTLSVTITLEDGSVMKGELYPDLAPITVANFKKLCDSDFYDGLIFHRVIDGFMIQGGGYDKDMNFKEADTIKGEFVSNGVANGLFHDKGVISMARASDPDSATSQFFIVDETASHLDYEYAAFGIITEGLDVLEKISAVETGSNEYGMTDVPVEPIIIKTIDVE